eukprot:Seg3133.2 transcript_id=Seg3133.2/GoldUCD/mRNA.D3Y31 product="hypothetical protein" protein_id=Seg3133.2/GoldUCD/D3Y31
MDGGNGGLFGTDELSCENCSQCILFQDNFCSSCGANIDKESVVIRYYFKAGYKYDVILAFLGKYHQIKISMRTLKKRLKSLGLGRRSQNFDANDVTLRVQQELDGPGRLRGYRSVWHSLRMDGLSVPRNVVANILREEDPDGCAERSRRRLKRRVYINQGPNAVWHIDGYDKLKPYGFPIHGCINGYSRKILWLFVSRSNNDPVVIGNAYLEAVKEFNGCPLKVRSDLGTENGLVATAQGFFRNDLSAHIYGSSPHNQRIEGWWSFLRRNRSSWWINLLKDTLELGVFSTCNVLEMECLWFCFAKLIQRDLKRAKDDWNTHYIRKSRHETIAGRPNELYFLPELHGGMNMLSSVPNDDFQQTIGNMNFQEVENDYQENFEYVLRKSLLALPDNWRQAFELYHHFLHFADDQI